MSGGPDSKAEWIRALEYRAPQILSEAEKGPLRAVGYAAKPQVVGDGKTLSLDDRPTIGRRVERLKRVPEGVDARGATQRSCSGSCSSSAAICGHRRPSALKALLAVLRGPWRLRVRAVIVSDLRTPPAPLPAGWRPPILPPPAPSSRPPGPSLRRGPAESSPQSL